MQVHLLRAVFPFFSDVRNAHQPQTGAAKQRTACVSRRSVACMACMVCRPCKTGQLHNFRCICPYLYHEKLFEMRRIRLVSGNPLDQSELPPPRGIQADGAILDLDVSHLRHGSHHPSALDTIPSAWRDKARTNLYERHFQHGVSDRLLPAEEGYLSLGLQ